MALISLLAALHVFIFSAAFPFFNSVDEQLHFDLVVRYAHADVPRQLEPIAPESIRYVALFHSLAFLADPAELPDGQLLPPPWKLPESELIPLVLAREREWRSILNPEGSQPPLYYSLAGAWWRLGRLIGLDGARVLYWLRFLNGFIVVAVVWLAWLTARKIYPENQFIRSAAPSLVALMPQTAFYSINSDILPPLLFGGVFLLLLKFSEATPPSPRLSAAIGILLAACFLAKISTLPLIVAVATFFAVKLIQPARETKKSAAILTVCLTLPMAAWMAWCKIHFGDFTGSSVKIHALTWTERPVHEWLNHPLFSLHGLGIFSRDTFASFWQGEFFWLHRPLALPALNAFYAVMTTLLLGLGFLAARKNASATARRAARLTVGCVAAAAAFFMLLSVRFDFQECFYPSREHPFFTSGRLYLGLLVPLMTWFAAGLDYALKPVSATGKFVFLGALLLLMLAGELITDWQVFACDYNWFHL